MDIDDLFRLLPHFDREIDSWTLSEIATKIGVREELLESRLQFWVREGLLRETNRHQYELNEQGND
jgi:predicted transcriptional regulator